MTAAITWAVLATGIGIYAAFGWRSCARQACRLDRMGYGQFFRAEKLAGELASIKLKRHLSAKHARAAQLAAKRLQVVGKAAEINREMGR
jgi:hypothetical protein